jgi:psp operon transcriptional activator
MAVELDWPNWPGFSPRAVAELEVYPWPGNVRELRNVVERAVYRHEDPERPVDEIIFDPFRSPWAPNMAAAAPVTAPVVEAATAEEAPAPLHLVQPTAEAPSTSDFRAAVSSYERQLLEDALRRNRFNQRATAAALSLSYDQLRHALKRHKLLDAEAAG